MLIGYSASYTIPANSALNIPASEFGIVSFPSGYQPIAVNIYNTGSYGVLPSSIHVRATNTVIMVALRNITNSPVTATFDLQLLYTKLGVVYGN